MKKQQLVFLSMLWMLLTASGFQAQASVSVAPATGGSCLALSPGAYTVLSNITITEAAVTDFAVQSGTTLILTAPAGFEFNPAAGSLSVAAGADIALATLSMTTTTITVTLNIPTNTKMDILRIRNIEVRATAANASGNIQRLAAGGTATITGDAPGAGIGHGFLLAVGAGGTFTTAANGLWSSPATWAGGVIPSCGDNVIIQHQITSDMTIGVNNLTINNTGKLTSDLAVSVAGTFAITGNGAYTHNNITDAATTIFAGIESFSATSTITVNKWYNYTVPFPTNISGKFGHLIFNTPYTWQQNGLFAPDRIMGDLTVTAGIMTLDNGTGMTTNLTLQNVTVSGTGRLYINTGTPRDLNLTTGNYTISSSSSNGSSIMYHSVGDLVWIINGNLSVAQRFSIVEGTSVADSGSATIFMSGNFAITGGVFDGFKSAVGPLTMNVAGTTLITNNPPTVSFKDKFTGDVSFTSGPMTVTNARNIYFMGRNGAMGLAQVTINGDLNISGSLVRFYLTYCDTNYNDNYLTVTNDLILADGQMYVGNNSGGSNISIGRNYTQTGATSVFNGQKSVNAFGNVAMTVNGSFSVLGGLFYQSRGYGSTSLDVTEVVTISNATFGGMMNSTSGNNGNASLSCSDLNITASKFYLHRGEISDSRSVDVNITNAFTIDFTDSTQQVILVGRAGVNNAVLNLNVGSNFTVSGNNKALFCSSLSNGPENISITNDINISGGRVRFNAYEMVSSMGHSVNGTVGGSVFVSGGSLAFAAQKGIANWTINNDLSQTGGYIVYKWNSGAATVNVMGNYTQMNGNAYLYSKGTVATADVVTLNLNGNADFQNATFSFDSCLTSTAAHQLVFKGANVTFGDNTIFTHRSHLSGRTNFGHIRYDRPGTINLVRSTANFDMQQVKQTVTAGTNVDFSASAQNFMIASYYSTNSIYHTTLYVDGTLDIGTNMIAARQQPDYYANINVNSGGRLVTGHQNGLYNVGAGASGIYPLIGVNYRMNFFLDPNSTVEYAGNDTQVITGTGYGIATTSNHRYGYLDINHQGTPDVEFAYPFDDSVVVRTGLVLTNGELNLDSDHATAGGGRTLTVMNGATIARTDGYIRSETEDGSAALKWNITTTGSFTVPFGYNSSNYIPFIYQPISGSSGDVVLATFHSAADNTPYPPTVTHVRDFGGADNSANTVDRFWRIQVPGNVTSTLTFSVTPAELGGIVNPRAQLWEPVSLGWFPPSGIQFNPTATTTQAGNITSLNTWWTLSSQSNPLPVELLSFDAKAEEKKVKLSWVTASEINNDFFTVERSKNGVEYTDILTVDGNGTTTNVNNYKEYDENPFQGVNYYRLRQTDFDGHETWSDVKVVSFTKAGAISLYPNPFHSDEINITTADANNQVNEVKVFDATGKLVYSQSSPSGFGNDGVATINLSSTVAEGTYFMEVTTDQGVFRERIVKM